MSKSTSESKEIHAFYKQNTDRFFEEVEKSITNLQRAYTAAWKNMIESAIPYSMNLQPKQA